MLIVALLPMQTAHAHAFWQPAAPVDRMRPEAGFFENLRVLHQAGPRAVDFTAALTLVVLPVLKNLLTALAVPYVLSRGVLPLLAVSFGWPPMMLQIVRHYAYAAMAVSVLLWFALRACYASLLRLERWIRDEKYLLGRQLENYVDEEPPQPAAVAAAEGS